MKILVVSHLFDDVASGPSWSVPAYVESLAKIDDVLWINTNEDFMPHWGNVSSFHKLSEFGHLHLKNMPESFQRPEVVVFQGFNFLEQVFFAYELRNKQIPYVIVPRGSLTHKAINNHAKYKKWIAHKLLLNRFVHKAASIQYLTKEEYEDSGVKWNEHSFVLPNGFTNNVVKKKYSENSIKGVFIGRLDLYHKGIDNLLEAVGLVANEMRKSNFTISFYGPHKYDYAKIKEYIKNKNLLDILSIHGPVSGDAKSAVLLESDVFFLTSRFEGHPMGLIEALSYGLPAFVTRGSNMLNEIETTNSGWTIDINNKEEISNALLSVIENSKELSLKGKNARQLSLKFDWTKLAEILHGKLIDIIHVQNRQLWGVCQNKR